MFRIKFKFTVAVGCNETINKSKYMGYVDFVYESLVTVDQKFTSSHENTKDDFKRRVYGLISWEYY